MSQPRESHNWSSDEEHEGGAAAAVSSADRVEGIVFCEDSSEEEREDGKHPLCVKVNVPGVSRKTYKESEVNCLRRQILDIGARKRTSEASCAGPEYGPDGVGVHE
eukprot:CAMPEP_0194541378 /NCGR_PEP_ID=MMETSP0253-20130528/82106_1 /TAXON_ID=2966 /ORGANISM="Noctiluca scintillans" /LENGTH=105 /DNA_ID=CAMNT_0039387861 /DNA_START=32 /DNA_END=346 /DNA_ORIENTATION=+